MKQCDVDADTTDDIGQTLMTFDIRYQKNFILLNQIK